MRPRISLLYLHLSYLETRHREAGLHGSFSVVSLPSAGLMEVDVGDMDLREGPAFRKGDVISRSDSLGVTLGHLFSPRDQINEVVTQPLSVRWWWEAS